MLENEKYLFSSGLAIFLNRQHQPKATQSCHLSGPIFLVSIINHEPTFQLVFNIHFLPLTYELLQGGV
jgi:hypothetical protein